MKRSRNKGASPRQSARPDRPTAASGDGHAVGEAADGFSALDLRDRVVIMLLFNGIVRVEQVARAWEQQQKLLKRGKNEALWRVLASHPGVDRERIYAAAAEVYVFKRAELAPSSIVSYLESVRGNYTERQWAAMRQLCVLPVWQKDQLGYSEKVQFTFATHDPTRPEAQRLVQALGRGRFELLYAPESLLRSLLEKAFPGRGGALRRSEQPDDIAYDLDVDHGEEDVRPNAGVPEAATARDALANLFRAALDEAARRGASDVRVHLSAEAAEVHFQIDGAPQRWSGGNGVEPETLKAALERA